MEKLVKLAILKLCRPNGLLVLCMHADGSPGQSVCVGGRWDCLL